MITRAKLIAAAAAAALALSAIAGAWWHGDRHGRLKCEHAATQAVIVHQQEMRELSDMVEAERAKRAPVVREKIEVIRYVEDPTGCADTTVPADILGRLLH